MTNLSMQELRELLASRERWLERVCEERDRYLAALERAHATMKDVRSELTHAENNIDTSWCRDQICEYFEWYRRQAPDDKDPSQLKEMDPELKDKLRDSISKLAEQIKGQD